MIAPLALLPEYLTAHLQLTLLALGLGIVSSVPLGVLLTRSPRLQRPVLAAVSVIRVARPSEARASAASTTNARQNGSRPSAVRPVR